MRSLERAVGLDVHRDFCEVAIVESGALRFAGRIETTPEALELFAQSLALTDRVALEVTGSAWGIARILEPHVARVVVVSPADSGIRQARAKTDRLDARTLARLLWAGELDPVWMPDEQTSVLRRRLARREQLVRARSRAKNEVHAVLMRCLKGKPPFSDLFGVKARQWLAQLELPVAEQETVAGCLRHVEFLDREIAAVEALIAEQALESEQARRLMTVPGIGPLIATAIAVLAPPPETFRKARDFAAWLGLVPRQHSTGGKQRLGATTKMGERSLRRLLILGANSVIIKRHVHAAARPGTWLAGMLSRKPPMLVRVALANKMARIVWALMVKGQDYRAPAAAA